MILRRVYVVALIEIIIFLLVILFYVFNTIRRHGNVVGDSPFGSYGEDFFVRHSVIVNILSHCFMIILSAVLLYFYCIPVLRDLPAALNDDYIENRGYVVKWSYSQENTNKLRTISIIDETGEEIALKVYGYGLHKDEYIKVRYFKHSKYGKVVYE